MTNPKLLGLAIDKAIEVMRLKVGRSEQLIAFQNFLILDGQLDLEPDEVLRNAEIFLSD